MPKEKTTGHDRTRLWTAIVYPDSAPENWRELLDEQHIPWVESPLHDKDVNPTTGELKKAHTHIAMSFEGPKSYEQVCKILEPLNCPAPQRCQSMKGTLRYFAHKDNPEKYQYDMNDIVAHGGFDIEAVLAPTASERYSLIKEMMEYCVDHDCTEYADLVMYAMQNRYNDWFPLLCDSSTIHMNAFLRSLRYKRGVDHD